MDSKELFETVYKIKQLNDILLQENLFLKKEMKSF